MAEHWPEIAAIQFRNKTAGTNADNWISNGSNLLFLVVTRDSSLSIEKVVTFVAIVQTGLSLFSCRELAQTVGADGMLNLSLRSNVSY